MSTTRAAWLVCGVLLGCAPQRHAAPERGTTPEGPPVNAVSEAPAKRAIADAAAHTPDALGSFWRRVWPPEFERLLGPVRASSLGATLPPELSGPAVAAWQSRLNEAWETTDPDPVLETTAAVIAQAAPLRDQLEVWLKTHEADAQAHAAVAPLRAILVEIVQEAELLALRDTGRIASFEEFVARYPAGPYTASVLFALGVLHEGRRDLADAKEAFRRVVERFAAHPLAAQAREKIREL